MHLKYNDYKITKAGEIILNRLKNYVDNSCSNVIKRAQYNIKRYYVSPITLLEMFKSMFCNK